MANRRMLSKTVVQTQRFLRLPLEAQALYCHLVVNADDDGIVEAFPIMRMINANEDSLNLLTLKQYLLLLNNEMVYFIKDFFEQNTIKADRYTPSSHRQLLIDYLKDNQLLENLNLGPRLVNYLQNTRLQVGASLDPDGNRNIIKDKISKDRIGKDKLSQDKIGLDSDPISSRLTDDIWLMETLWHRELTRQEKVLLEGLTVSDSLLQLAIHKTAELEPKKQNMSYVKGILMNWEARGFITADQVIASEKDYRPLEISNVEVSEDFIAAMDIWKD
ncbi:MULTISPECIES: DnaD domain protein [Streptococcus]|uniref:DnaD domain protein n=1 Tax=Streptococcus TaxID=1301 RepID=UPI001F2C45CB|nr:MULTISPECIES: DnaD domain protein [Streptococcus]MCG9932801.1 DnaD domain protein [Streptococcus suis]MCH1681944.1 DnaD domain protein [Streptococcus suis]MCH1683907.1 DnaD domain protein [Streptococcus suis]MCL4886228.1 DnaD domain protein [Streptococcus suis]MCL4900549.1 DnaD domain protein [Streptococcus suis]